jgi:hypothetical protein
MHMHTYIRTCMHADVCRATSHARAPSIHTYIYTCIHTYIHTGMCRATSHAHASSIYIYIYIYTGMCRATPHACASSHIPSLRGFAGNEGTLVEMRYFRYFNNMSTWVYVYSNVCVQKCMCIQVQWCFKWFRVFVCVYICVCTHTHTHTYWCAPVQGRQDQTKHICAYLRTHTYAHAQAFYVSITTCQYAFTDEEAKNCI